MAVLQNMVQKSLTKAAREAGVEAAVALKDMNAWVQAYVEYPLPFFNFKDVQSDVFEQKEFSLSANADFVERVVNIKGVPALKDAVISALKKNDGAITDFQNLKRDFNYFGIITAYNENEIATRIIKFRMILEKTVVKTLCGGTSATHLNTAYDTYQFVADKQLLIKMHEKMGDKMIDQFADKLLDFMKDFYDEALADFGKGLVNLFKNKKPA